ncbi:MAG: bifunctional nuclease family protein [Armatimonadetes bacterium]|nr:bifunctional nuclease family protein [Armatimonadota bacterium]
MDRVQMEIIGLTSSPQTSGSYALILQETGGIRRLSILIGGDLAQVIALELESLKPPRPITHDLMKAMIDALGVRLLDVCITELRESTFYAVLNIEGVGEPIDARPSDAIALAIRCGAGIYVAEAVLAEAGVLPNDDEDFDDDEEDENDRFEGEAEAEESKPERPKTLREVLQGKLDVAVKQEDYERAAQIRDEIDRLDRNS